MASKPTSDPAGGAVRLPAEIIFRPLRTRNLFEETVARLAQAIRLGVVPVGERLPTERELHEQLGVSRITIREALRALEEAGFVEIRRGRHGGAYVLRTKSREEARGRPGARKTKVEIGDAMDLRRAIEPTIAELAAERHDAAQLAQARELLAESERVQPDQYRAADSHFHLALATMAHSPRLAAAAADVQLQYSEIVATMALVVEESMRHSHVQHHAILDAIAARDGEAARLAMFEHVEGTAILLGGLS